MKNEFKSSPKELPFCKIAFTTICQYLCAEDRFALGLTNTKYIMYLETEKEIWDDNLFLRDSHDWIFPEFDKNNWLMELWKRFTSAECPYCRELVILYKPKEYERDDRRTCEDCRQNCLSGISRNQEENVGRNA